jgi:hypothetical protein
LLIDVLTNSAKTNALNYKKRYHANGSTTNLQLSIRQTGKGDINGNQNQDRRKGTAQKSEMFRAASKANKKGETKKIENVQTFFKQLNSSFIVATYVNSLLILINTEHKKGYLGMLYRSLSKYSHTNNKQGLITKIEPPSTQRAPPHHL